MQTATKEKKALLQDRTNIGRRERQVGHCNRSKNEKKVFAPTHKISRFDFLKTVIKPFPAYSVGFGFDFDTDEIKQLCGREPTYIIATANNYLKLLGSKKQLQSTGNLAYDCVAASSALSTELPENQFIDFCFFKGQFSLCIYTDYSGSFPDYFLFYLPIAIVNDMPFALAALFKQFISSYVNSQSISLPDEHYHFSMMLDTEFYGEQDYICDDLNEVVELYTKGKASKVFDEIRSIHVNADTLRESIIAYQPHVEDKYRQLLNLMIQGIDLFKGHNICEYAYYTLGDECLFPTLFAIIWEDDLLVQNVVEMVNFEFNECENQPIPYSWKALTPNDTEILIRDNYPIDFANWWMKMYNVITQIYNK